MNSGTIVGKGTRNCGTECYLLWLCGVDEIVKIFDVVITEDDIEYD